MLLADMVTSAPSTPWPGLARLPSLGVPPGTPLFVSSSCLASLLLGALSLILDFASTLLCSCIASSLLHVVPSLMAPASSSLLRVVVSSLSISLIDITSSSLTSTSRFCSSAPRHTPLLPRFSVYIDLSLYILGFRAALLCAFSLAIIGPYLSFASSLLLLGTPWLDTFLFQSLLLNDSASSCWLLLQQGNFTNYRPLPASIAFLRPAIISIQCEYSILIRLRRHVRLAREVG